MSRTTGSIRRRVLTLAGLLFLGSGATALAVADVGILGGAEAEVPATRVEQPAGDLVVVYDSYDVDRFVIDRSDIAARRVGGTAATSRSGAVGIISVTRDGDTVHAPPAGWLIPITYVSFDRGPIAGIYGRDLSQALAGDRVVLNEMTADLMDAEVGDRLALRGHHGNTVRVTVGGIVSYEQLGGAELVFTSEISDRIGDVTENRVVIFGFDDRAGILRALGDVGIVGRKHTRVRHSWDTPDPDDTISTARTKVALGEPWYRVNSNDTISMHPAWLAANIPPGRELLSSAIPIRAQCNRRITADLSAALDEVAAAGLGWAIEIGNTNTYGGCYNPRYSRISGYLSRHAYGQAIDMNTVSNCQGCVPRMDCRVVRIFRKHNFAWGGNFRIPDGMHFEWVGERRDQIPYDSTYCDNVVTGPAAFREVPELGLDVLVLADPAHEHDHSEHADRDDPDGRDDA